MMDDEKSSKQVVIDLASLSNLIHSAADFVEAVNGIPETKDQTRCLML